MRILHVTDGFAPVVGGIETHVEALARSQQSAGDRVRVVTLTPGGPATPGLDVVRLTSAASAGQTGIGPGRVAGLSRELAQLLESDPRGRPDVLHVHASVVSPLAASAIRAAHDLRVPALVTVHSFWAGLGPLPWLVRHGLDLPAADVVWSAVSGPAASALGPVVAPRRVAVLGNAVEPRDWAGLAPVARAPGDPVHLVAVMRLTRVKRSVPLVAVLREVRRRVPEGIGIRATIAGDGPERHRVVRYLRRHRMSDWVELPGMADRQRVRALLAGADLFVAPARRESFGIAALEARAAGVPVVALRDSGVAEFVRDGAEGVLARDDADLAERLAGLCTDPGYRALLRHHNLTTPVDHDWDRARREARRLYEDAARLVGVPQREGVR